MISGHQTLGDAVSTRYMRTMDTVGNSLGRTVAIGLAALAAAMLTGVAFAGWMNHGAEVFLTFTASGLAWCL